MPVLLRCRETVHGALHCSVVHHSSSPPGDPHRMPLPLPSPLSLAPAGVCRRLQGSHPGDAARGRCAGPPCTRTWCWR
jgi:hypothetical protein